MDAAARLEVPAGTDLPDRFGRVMRYLRISLTDRCNFGCVYCVPKEGLSRPVAAKSLSRAEIRRLVEVLATAGVHKVRLTGGEPLLRKDLREIIADLTEIPGLSEIAMTTNGSLLAPMAAQLRDAGLQSVNISLDRLDAKRFAEICGTDLYERVLEGTFAALEAGLSVKLNMVILRDLSEEDICAFVDLAMRHAIDVRFLEFMPLCGQSWDTRQFWPVAAVRSLVQKHYQLEPPKSRHDQVAQTFRLKEGKGSVGFIGSISESFCEACDRLRITTDGKLRTCLFSSQETDLRPFLCGNTGALELLEEVRRAVWTKPAGNQFFQNPFNGTGTPPPVAPGTPLIHDIGG